jgi:hypothetical protein
VDGERVEVTDNLYDALLRFRHPWSSRCLWIDALCINQEDLVERESQVEIMLSIFQRAEKVIGWLGESGQGSAGAFKLIKSFVKYRINPMIFHTECSTTNRTFFTINGQENVKMGVGPYDAQAGDVAAVLYGSDRCFVLRPRTFGDAYTVVGTVYVYGVMYGEL